MGQKTPIIVSSPWKTWPHLINGSLGPPNGMFITSAVFAGLMNVTNRQTHRQTDHATSISPHVTQCMSNNTSYCNSLSIDHMQHLMNCFMSQLLLRPWLVNSSCWLGNPPTKAKVNSLVAINKLNGLKCTTNVILYVMFVYQEKQISRVWCEDRSLLKDEAASSRCK